METSQQLHHQPGERRYFQSGYANPSVKEPRHPSSRSACPSRRSKPVLRTARDPGGERMSLSLSLSSLSLRRLSSPSAYRSAACRRLLNHHYLKGLDEAHLSQCPF